MLSVNTLSKLSLLIGDNLASNVLLHGLFMGKPVILAQNGVDPSDAGRIEPHFPGASSGLVKAIEERLETVRNVRVCRNRCAASFLPHCIAAITPGAPKLSSGARVAVKRASAARRKNNIITAADVLQAHHSGAQLRLSTSAVVTPLARELASKHGVCLLQSGSN